MLNIQSPQAAEECKLLTKQNISNITTVKIVISYFQILDPMNLLRYIYTIVLRTKINVEISVRGHPVEMIIISNNMKSLIKSNKVREKVRGES